MITKIQYSLLDVWIFQGVAILVYRGDWLNAIALAGGGFIISSLLKDRQ